MDLSERTRYFMFSKEDVLKLLQYRIEYNHLFLGKRGTAIRGWKLVAQKLKNGSNERHVAKKFSNLINMHNKYNSILKHNPEYEINWPYFDVMKEAIRMLNSLKETAVHDDDDGEHPNDKQLSDDSNYVFLQQQFDNDTTGEGVYEDEDVVEIKQEEEEEEPEEAEDNDHDPSTYLVQQQKMWHTDLVMKLIHLRGIKYAHYFVNKDKITNNRGWSKIHADKQLQSLDEKQLRKKWQNMAHRFKSIYEAIQRGDQSEKDVSWQYYKPMHDVYREKKLQQAQAASRFSQNSLNGTGTSDMSPNNTPEYQDECYAEPLEPLVVVNTMGSKMMEFSRAIVRDDLTNGKDLDDDSFAQHDSYGDCLNDTDGPPKRKIPRFDEPNASSSFVVKTQSNTSQLLAYQRRRDQVLFKQNNNMLKMMKALLQKQGVSIPFDVSVDFSQL